MMNGLANANRTNVRYLPQYSRRNPNLGNVAMHDELARGTRGAGLLGIALGDRSNTAYRGRGMMGVALGDRSPWGFAPRGIGDVSYSSPNLGHWEQNAAGNYIWVTGEASGNPGHSVPITTSGGGVNWAQFATTLAATVGSYLTSKQQLDAAKFQWQVQGGQIPGAANGGQGLTGAVGQITTWASENPLLVVAIGAGLFLFLAPSPRSGKR